MVDQLRSFAAEVTRVAREVGTEGKLGGQAEVQGVAGHVEGPHRQRQLDGVEPDRRRCATSPKVTTAVAQRRPGQKITVDVQGRDPRSSRTPSTRWSTSCSSFAAEVTRVAREVGTEGKLGGQAEVRGRVGHLEGPHRQRQLDGVEPDRPGAQHRRGRRPRSRTATSSQKITVDVKGEILELKDTINTMVDQLNSFAAEVTRVAREVGTEGKLGGQAEVRGRRRHLEGPHRQRQLAWRRTSPRRCATSPRSRPRSRTATCRRRSPSTCAARSSSSRTPSTRWSTSCARSPPR